MLLSLRKQLNKTSKLEWAVSHQDNDLTLDIVTLLIGLQLNIEGDKLAIEGLQCLHPIINQEFHLIHPWRFYFTMVDAQY